jgi:hypothetical protein
VFAAASNNKANEENPIGYPARVKEYVVCINSSSGQDVRSSFSPHGQVGRENFSTVGESVEAAWPLELNNGQNLKRRSGTSCATPIAAGIAALILEYSRQIGFPKIQHSQRLKQLPGMKKVLFECMTARNTDRTYNYLKPWTFLGPGDPQSISMLNDTRTGSFGYSLTFGAFNFDLRILCSVSRDNTRHSARIDVADHKILRSAFTHRCFADEIIDLY